MDRNVLNSTTLRNAVVFYYFSNEGISIVENLAMVLALGRNNHSAISAWSEQVHV